MTYKRSKLPGFTIVELLIVVVVIAILAAVTVVAYNGITQQARSSAAASTADTYVKIISLFRVETGNLLPVGGWDEATACLGTIADYPARDGFQEGECVFDDNYRGSERRSHAIRPETTEALSAVAVTSTIPSGSIPLAIDGSTHYRGLTYHKIKLGHYDEHWNYIQETPYYHIHYYLQGKQTCPSGKAFIEEKVTHCMITIDPPANGGVGNDSYGHGGEW